MNKSLKPSRRNREKPRREVHRNRLYPARVFRVYPDPELPFIVEVRLARDRRRMHEAMRQQGEEPFTEKGCMGTVRSWYGKRTRRAAITRPRQLIARMYLNVRDLRVKPSEIVAHECTHAAMAYAHFRKANLSFMPGEEILCYAVGRLVRQVNRCMYAAGVWKTG